jgi:hypothetical protein
LLSETASTDAGQATCIAAHAPIALVTLATGEAGWSVAPEIAQALASLARTTRCVGQSGNPNVMCLDGLVACIEARAPEVLSAYLWHLARIAAAGASAAAGNGFGAASAEHTVWIARAVAVLAISFNAKAAFVAACAPAALAALAAEASVKRSAFAARCVAAAIVGIARFDDAGAGACAGARAPAALEALAECPAVRGSAAAAMTVAHALAKIAACEGGVGLTTCLEARAAAALAALKGALVAAQGNADNEAAASIRRAFHFFCASNAGRAACLEAGAPVTAPSWGDCVL